MLYEKYLILLVYIFSQIVICDPDSTCLFPEATVTAPPDLQTVFLISPEILNEPAYQSKHLT